MLGEPTIESSWSIAKGILHIKLPEYWRYKNLSLYLQHNKILSTVPTILFLFGLRFFFYSDEHLPMHVHVKNGDGKAKINIETAEVVENNGIKPADLNKAVDAVNQYKADMIKAWNEYFDED